MPWPARRKLTARLSRQADDAMRIPHGMCLTDVWDLLPRPAKDHWIRIVQAEAVSVANETRAARRRANRSIRGAAR